MRHHGSRPAEPEPEPDRAAARAPAGRRSGPGAWHASAAAAPSRAPLGEDLEVDVAIVGGGFSGLWTAFHLLTAEPSLRVVVLERERLGFGASGRNGGWLMGAPPADLRVWERRFGLAAVRAAQAVLVDAVGEVAQVTRDEAIDCGLRLAGELSVARSPAEVTRLGQRRAALARWGWPEDGLAWLDGDEVAARIGARGTRGALQVTPTGTLEPLQLVRGLAAAIERRGGRIFEQTAATHLAPGRVQCGGLVITAPKVVVATEAFTVQQPGETRRYLPLASTVIATAPLPAAMRAELGWTGGEAVGDAHHLFFYAQQTREGRIHIGGRGAPYRLGSAVDVAGVPSAAVVDRLRTTLHTLWPATARVPIEHAWSGSIAVARDWCASCGVDDASGIGWIGGYAGHGVGASFVLARSLAAQLRGVPDPAGPQPWMLHRPRRWEPEPLRWLASQSIVRLLESADRIEAAGGRTRRAALVHRFTGS